MRTLYTEDLSKAYRGRKVVDDVSLRVEQGEVVGLLGPNGAGKTTTFYMIVGLINPDSGSVLVRNGTGPEDMTQMPMYQRARRGISYLPQEASVFRKLTVQDNLMAILQTLRMSRRDRRRRMDELIGQLGLETVRHNKGYTLSGGERRRVEIARSLVIEPSFLLLRAVPRRSPTIRKCGACIWARTSTSSWSAGRVPQRTERGIHMPVTISPATEKDVPLVFAFVRKLAEYEKLPHHVTATEDDLRANLFGDRRAAEAVIAYLDGAPAGFAVFFHNFSTYTGKPGIYLEDLFVDPEYRTRGVGKALLKYLERLGRERGCDRLQWSVLKWNEQAIRFYNNRGAVPMEDWTLYRLGLRR